jgi:hypothetical protein
MTPFEDELKQALRRQEPAADFTARVLARCAEADAKARRGLRPMWQMAAIEAGLLLVAGGTAYEQHEREVRGMAAKQKLVLAMRIAGTKLHEVQQRVREVQE